MHVGAKDYELVNGHDYETDRVNGRANGHSECTCSDYTATSCNSGTPGYAHGCGDEPSSGW